jgi:hypothetical protein
VEGIAGKAEDCYLSAVFRLKTLRLLKPLSANKKATANSGFEWSKVILD